MGYMPFGPISSSLQDNAGVGISDPYFEGGDIGSSWSKLAQDLISGATNIGESYAASSVSGGQVIATGNPLAPTTVLPSLSQATQARQVRSQLAGGGFRITTGEVVVVGGIAALLVILLALRR